MIIGTAGHIDHGKSTLVQALTGQTMDRLGDEQRRGITIDLNFAALDLGEHGIAGVIDVPGHEDFVRTMVAGATGIDVVLLTVAADEGMMPQTHEHLAIAEQLGIPWGIPVITKVDQCDPEWLALVTEEVATRTAASPVEFQAPVPVAAPTGEGLGTLREALAALAVRVSPRDPSDVFRLPIDRAFSVAGVGTVVTGTCWSGSVAVGDQLEVVPGGLKMRVRSMECHGAAVEHGSAGQRLALGLVGADRDAIGRGGTVVAAGQPWKTVNVIDVEATLLEDSKALTARRRVRLLLGTREVIARAYPQGNIAGGESGVVRLLCESAIVARGGDRFVLRSYSPVATIGGGRVLDPSPPRRGSVLVAGLRSDVPVECLLGLVARRPAGLKEADFPVVTGLPPAMALELARGHSGLACIAGRWISESRVAAAADRAARVLGQFHAGSPARPGMPLETLRGSLGVPSWLAGAVVDRLAASGAFQIEGSLVRTAGFSPDVGGAEEVDRVVEALEQAGLTPPTVAKLGQDLGREDVGDVLREAARQGRVAQVQGDRYFASSALSRFAALLDELGGLDGQGEITPGAIRDRVDLSRKFIIPLLEWADREGLTKRAGQARRLASGQASRPS
jgi:selenocysteine-specific elongation factor